MDLVQLGIYDVSGRLIRQIFDGALGPGAHDLPWGGCRDEGRRAPAGIYLARVSAPEGIRTWKFMLMR